MIQPVRYYKVISSAVGGKRNKIFFAGNVIKETDLPNGNAEKLVKQKHLERLFDADKKFFSGNGQYLSNVYKHCQAKIEIPEIKRIYESAKKTEVLLSEKDIELSLIMPFFRAGNIAWLALESLSRQINIDFGWELIIIEENFDSPLGLEKILEYKDRLTSAGCASIKYIELSQWLPLSSKWYYMIQNSDTNSKVCCFNSADVYCPPQRLSKQFKVLTDGIHNWYRLAGNIIYDIETGLHVKRMNIVNKGDTCCRATTMNIAKKLPLNSVKKSVDGWTYNTFCCYGLKEHFDISDMWQYCVNVNGINNISIGRKERIVNKKGGLMQCCDGMTNHLPEDVYLRLKECKTLIHSHKLLLQDSNIKI